MKEAWRILPAESFTPLAVATGVAAVVGYLSIWFLLAFLRRNSTAIFIVYRIVVGVVLLSLLWFGIISPEISGG